MQEIVERLRREPSRAKNKLWNGCSEAASCSSGSCSTSCKAGSAREDFATPAVTFATPVSGTPSYLEHIASQVHSPPRPAAISCFGSNFLLPLLHSLSGARVLHPSAYSPAFDCFIRCRRCITTRTLLNRYAPPSTCRTCSRVYHLLRRPCRRMSEATYRCAAIRISCGLLAASHAESRMPKQVGRPKQLRLTSTRLSSTGRTLTRTWLEARRTPAPSDTTRRSPTLSGARCCSQASWQRISIPSISTSVDHLSRSPQVLDSATCSGLSATTPATPTLARTLRRQEGSSLQSRRQEETLQQLRHQAAPWEYPWAAPRVRWWTRRRQLAVRCWIAWRRCSVRRSEVTG